MILEVTAGLGLVWLTALAIHLRPVLKLLRARRGK
jgi:hypothetical protein